MIKGKTIKQIADEVGVTKQAVHQKMKKEPLSTSLQSLTVKH
jgi:predicted transcriptional regulator